MGNRLDEVFCDDAAALFQALPLMRKQVICAVLSGEDPLPSDPSTLRSNLCLPVVPWGSRTRARNPREQALCCGTHRMRLEVPGSDRVR